MRRFPIPLLGGALAAVLVLGACGNDDGASVRGSERSQPRAERIVSLSATATEMLFAIGAGDQVVAVDDQSDFPAEAPTTDLSGYNVNVEAVLSHDPDLVVAAYDPGGLVEGLEAADVPVVLHPATTTLAGAYDQLDELGDLTGHQDGAADVVADMRDRIDELVEDVPERPQPLTYYHELDDTLYTATRNTFVGELYALAGLVSIADGVDDGSGYPQVSNEFVISADPDFIFLADTKCCGQSLATVAARPGWAGMKAVTGNRVVELDDDVASRWGPRAVDLLEVIVEAVAAAPQLTSDGG